jgi:hypothetical protein
MLYRRALAVGVFVAVCLTITALAQTETVVQVAPGTYALSQVLTRSGTSTNPIHYRPTTAGTVVLRGGDITGVHDIILDGFRVEGRLDEDWPSKSRGLDIRTSSNITIMNTEVVGPYDIHTGYDIYGRPNCAEADLFPTQSGGIGTLDTSNITLKNVIVHGFRGAGSFRGTGDRVENSMFRNNFNGLSISSDDFAMVDSVMWVHPNHLFSIQGAGTVLLANNLLVDGQDMFQAGATWDGADDVSIVNNTFYIPSNKPCYGFTGLNLYSIHGTADFRNNIVINKDDGFLTVSDSSMSRLKSDYNLYKNYFRTTEEFFLSDRGVKVPIEDWRKLSGQDAHSVARLMPVFTNPPQYQDFDANQWGFRIPTSAAEARSWFVLRSGSPGQAVASDGGDIGIRGIGSTWTPPTSTRPRPPGRLRIIS